MSFHSSKNSQDLTKRVKKKFYYKKIEEFLYRDKKTTGDKKQLPFREISDTEMTFVKICNHQPTRKSKSFGK